jgi:hypothetical protein
LSSRWRAAVFSLALVASTFAGLYSHHNAERHPGLSAIPPFPPLDLDIYVSDPKVPVAVDIETVRVGNHLESYLFARSATPVDMLLRSNVRNIPPDNSPGARPKFHRIAESHGAAGYIYHVPPALTQSEYDPRGPALAVFRLKSQFFVNDDGSIQARLPEIAQLRSEFTLSPIAATTSNGSGTEPSSVYFHPKLTDIELLGDTRPSSYKVPSDEPVKGLFWDPQTLTSTEVLDGVADDISRSDVILNLPSNGRVQGGGFVWTAPGELSPVLSTTNRDLNDARGRDEFYSGVALATAAAALIALVQEGPERFRFWRRRPDHALSQPDQGIQTIEPVTGHVRVPAQPAVSQQDKNVLSLGTVLLILGVAAAFAARVLRRKRP